MISSGHLNFTLSTNFQPKLDVKTGGVTVTLVTTSSFAKHLPFSLEEYAEACQLLSNIIPAM
jgi:hypothetical protein